MFLPPSLAAFYLQIAFTCNGRVEQNSLNAGSKSLWDAVFLSPAPVYDTTQLELAFHGYKTLNLHFRSDRYSVISPWWNKHIVLLKKKKAIDPFSPFPDHLLDFGCCWWKYKYWSIQGTLSHTKGYKHVMGSVLQCQGPCRVQMLSNSSFCSSVLAGITHSGIIWWLLKAVALFF